ncbi:hypothetical protein NBRC116588_04970 [Pyruvatibacter sp. HU-CL02332]
MASCLFVTGHICSMLEQMMKMAAKWAVKTAENLHFSVAIMVNTDKIEIAKVNTCCVLRRIRHASKA